MGVNLYKLKKWFNMLTGRSIFHVNQGLGKSFVPKEIKGYYNDLTEKVTKDQDTLNKQMIPSSFTDDGKPIIFATTIFQYGLGAYDLIIQDSKEIYRSQFKKCSDWAYKNQDEKGGWDISSFAGKKSKYGAMAQGEGASLLIRAYVLYKDEKYKEAAKKAIDLMLTSLENGGTSKYNGEELFLMEFMDLPCVLNGWIFALFGLYDYIQVDNNAKYTEALEKTLMTLKNHLNDYDNGYWSMYDSEKMITSPFYHKLHIAQLEAISMIDSSIEFEKFRNRLLSYQSRFCNRNRAFIKKIIQKILEK